MKTAATLLAVLGLASAANAGVTLDDLSIATLTGGANVSGSTTGASNDMNGDTIGGTATGWNGGDDVYTVNWLGGDFQADLLFSNSLGDIDLFMFDNNSPSGELAQSITVDDNEQITIASLAAGTYYLSIDGWANATNSYQLVLNGVPTPASAALLGLGGLVATRRRR